MNMLLYQIILLLLECVLTFLDVYICSLGVRFVFHTLTLNFYCCSTQKKNLLIISLPFPWQHEGKKCSRNLSLNTAKKKGKLQKCKGEQLCVCTIIAIWNNHVIQFLPCKAAFIHFQILELTIYTITVLMHRSYAYIPYRTDFSVELSMAFTNKQPLHKKL